MFSDLFFVCVGEAICILIIEAKTVETCSFFFFQWSELKKEFSSLGFDFFQVGEIVGRFEKKGFTLKGTVFTQLPSLVFYSAATVMLISVLMITELLFFCF